jgi:hypothetical protein
MTRNAVAFRWHDTYNQQLILLLCHPSSEIVLLFMYGHIGLVINLTSYLKLVEYPFCWPCSSLLGLGNFSVR